MNKFAVLVSFAAAATLVGCKDPDYAGKPYALNRSEVKDAGEITTTLEPTAISCSCDPNTKHTAPCQCGASDCKCKVEVEPMIAVVDPAPNAKPVAPAAEYTTYIVQKGDYLAKISKKFNIKVDAIKSLNGLKNDTIRLGQKIKLPGKVDVGVQEEYRPTKAIKEPKAFKPYEGATFEYVVKSGDTLGAIAYGHGINIRQLKALNNLKKDNLKIGQKLQVPVVGEKPAETKAAPIEETIPAPADKEPTIPVETTVVDATVAQTAPAPTIPVDDVTYVVQEGDDITGVAIRWNISAAVIRDLNNLAEDAQLVPGQILKLPAEVQQ